MNLLLDLGNSRCKYAVLEPGVPDKFGALPYQEGKRLEVIESVLQQYNHLDRVVVCSVLGQEVNDQLQQRFLSNGPEGFYFLSSAAWSFGITIGYRNPDTLGADRLAALIAAHEQYHGCTCIVDWWNCCYSGCTGSWRRASWWRHIPGVQKHAGFLERRYGH